ncbi:CGH_1_collapsed_G0056710.mRNA.1.CDS.1 [Saccharomyces cerevisiae]|nr:CGH_1_collapsed_G0056710.mRNA.1.CDS.1 [Saccharomyces cerevisiae]
MSGLLLICSALKRVVLKITAVVCSVFSIRVLILATKIKKTCHECGTHLEIIWEGNLSFARKIQKWTTKHQNLKKGQPCKDEDAVTVPLPSSDPGKETQLETKLCFVPEPGDQPLVQA